MKVELEKMDKLQWNTWQDSKKADVRGTLLRYGSSSTVARAFVMEARMDDICGSGPEDKFMPPRSS